MYTQNAIRPYPNLPLRKRTLKESPRHTTSNHHLHRVPQTAARKTSCQVLACRGLFGGAGGGAGLQGSSGIRPGWRTGAVQCSLDFRWSSAIVPWVIMVHFGHGRTQERGRGKRERDERDLWGRKGGESSGKQIWTATATWSLSHSLEELSDSFEISFVDSTWVGRAWKRIR